MTRPLAEYGRSVEVAGTTYQIRVVKAGASVRGPGSGSGVVEEFFGDRLLGLLTWRNRNHDRGWTVGVVREGAVRRTVVRRVLVTAEPELEAVVERLDAEVRSGALSDAPHVRRR